MLQGKYPKIFDNDVIGNEAKKLFADANTMLDELQKMSQLKASGVIGLFPANTTGPDTITIYTDESKGRSITTIECLRQQGKKADGIPNLSLADFIAPENSGHTDYLGFFAVTAGIGIEHILEKYQKEHDDYQSIMLKAIADRLAEAFAEYLHEQVRKKHWGYAANESLANEELIREKYIGIRPAPGYPACPDHTEKPKIFETLDVTNKTGIKLTESMAMYPASSVCGMYFSHPQSKYFGLGKIGKDQIEDYSKRKSMNIGEIEKWLSPVLNY